METEMIHQYEVDEEVVVVPFRFVSDLALDCLPVPGKVVYRYGVKGGALYTVLLLQNSTHGWYKGDTVRVHHYNLKPLTKENGKVEHARPEETPVESR